VTTFDEEFSGAAGSGPDASRWTPAYGGNGFGNGELQYYTGRPDNVTTDGAGNLVITARKEPFTGADGVTRQYTSAKLSTLRTFSFQYGTVTSRMRIPANGPGLLPALWALGTDLPDVGWPHCGEIDIMENIGSEPTIAHATLHGGTTAGLEDWVSAGVYRSDAPIGSEFRTFELVWGPDGISGRADGHTFFTVGASDIAPGHEWSFNHPFFLVLNLAVGGDWPGSPDATTVFPASMAVDYVRVSA
jgi:beta-glucanase (GH16 family)